MNRETASDFVKRQEPDFLQRAKKKINGKPSFVCPKCGNGSGKDGDGIARIKDHYKCFNCGLYEDIIGLWKLSQGITDDKEAFNTLYEHYNITIDSYQDKATDRKEPAAQIRESKGEEMQEIDFTALYLQANKDIEKTDYHRGISLETLNRFKVGYIEYWKHPESPNAPESPRLIIPVSKYSYIARDTRHGLTGKAKEFQKLKVKGKEKPTWIFNRHAIERAKQPIIVVEGEIDALSIIDVGGEAVGLGSIANINEFIEYLKTNKPAQPLILSLDNDKDREDGKNPGQEAEGRLAAALEELGITFYRHNIAGDFKDANEFLQHDREAFKNEVYKAGEAEAWDYDKDTCAASYIQDFVDGIAKSKDTPCIATGFTELDRVLDGGLYEGLYIIGAISSLGKTTLVLQVADQIAQTGQDVIIFSLEMARGELMSKSISRNTILEVLENNGNMKHAKTARGITDSKRYKNYSQEESSIIKKAIRKYGSYATHLYIHEGIGDIGVEKIREIIEKHIRLKRQRPVVIIDYLQILAPYSDRASDKQNTDKAVLELKRISRDHKIPVIAISSFNRASYKDKVTMEAFKESGAIEYSSDILIGLQLKGVEKKDFDVDKAKRANPREIELVILKNRNGSTGDKVTFNYYTLFNYFKEIEERQVDFSKAIRK